MVERMVGCKYGRGLLMSKVESILTLQDEE
jgi:hypothetical protein